MRTYERLKKHMRNLGIVTNLSFIEYALNPAEQPPEVDFDFLMIDGDHPNQHNATFRIGACVYRFNGLEFDLVQEHEAVKLLTQYEGEEIEVV